MKSDAIDTAYAFKAYENSRIPWVKRRLRLIMVKIWYWKLSYPNLNILYHLINSLIKVKIKGLIMV